MSQRSIDSESAERRAVEGLTTARLGRAGDRAERLVDPLDPAARARDPQALAEKVVFRLWADGQISGRAIEQARREGDKRARLDQNLVRLGLVHEEDAAAALAAEIEAPEAHDGDFPERPILADLLPRRFVEEALALPIADADGHLTMAMADPMDEYALRAVALKTRRHVHVVVAAPSRLRAEIARLYRDGAAVAAPRRPSAAASPSVAQSRSAEVQPRPAQPRPTGAPAAAAPSAPFVGERHRDTQARPVRSKAPEPIAGPREDTMIDRLAANADPRSVATPRFVRPKRVTRASRAETPAEPTAIARADATIRGQRRFVTGFVGGFIGADPFLETGAGGAIDDFDDDWIERAARDDRPAPEARPQRRAAVAAAAIPTPQAAAPARSRRNRPDDAAQKSALAEVHRVLRAQATIADHGAIDRRAADPKYRATRALAERDAATAAGERGSVLRHRLVAPAGRAGDIQTKPANGAPAVRSTAAAPDSVSGSPRAPIVFGEARAEDVAPAASAALEAALAGGEGLVLICGPAGSAKMATLRDLARRVAGPDADIPRFDVAADRSLLRRNGPSSIAIGEIRDAESAEAALRFAMMGGLVIATLDAATATGAPGRLIDLGVPPYAVASSLRVAVTQRLSETKCLRCAQTGRSVSGAACAECDGRGAERRVAIDEAMALDDTLRALVLAGAPEAALRHAMDAEPAAALRPRRKRDRRAAQRIASAATSGAYGFGAP